MKVVLLAALVLSLASPLADAKGKRTPASEKHVKGKSSAKLDILKSNPPQKVVQAQIEGAPAQMIYENLDVEENTAKGPGGGQQQKVGDGYTCVNDPADGYSCVIQFNQQGLVRE